MADAPRRLEVGAIALDRIWTAITTATASWHQGKLFLEHAIAVSHDALHVIVGVLVQLVFSLVLRRPISSPIPWLWVFALTLWNETVDLWFERWPNAAMQFGEGAKDLGLTILLPTVLMLAARHRPDLFRRGLRPGKQHR